MNINWWCFGPLCNDNPFTSSRYPDPGGTRSPELLHVSVSKKRIHFNTKAPVESQIYAISPQKRSLCSRSGISYDDKVYFRLFTRN
jgi:hypothetical protein